jgi:hypothetical protein
MPQEPSKESQPTIASSSRTRFHERFEIPIGDKDAKKRFVSRVRNRIFEAFFQANISDDVLQREILWEVANALGEEYIRISLGNYDKYIEISFDSYIKDDFHRCLQALEVAYQALRGKNQKKKLNDVIEFILRESEVDLGIAWKDGTFIKTGAALLDKGLVNEPLRWLSTPKYKNVYTPFQKGLSHFLEAEKHPERLADTVTDLYEALEALAKIVTKKPGKDLSANAELFIKEIHAGAHFKKMLKDYIAYANEFRHAVEEGKERAIPSAGEVEAFIYLTGLFIRLAIVQP